METVEKVKTNIDAVVERRTKVADDRLAAALRELDNERRTRAETEKVLAETTWALSDLRKKQAVMTEMQEELQATVSQMRDDLNDRDKELAALKPGGHRASLWGQPRTVDDLGRKTFDGMKAQLVQTEAQLAEAVQIIRELTDVVQGNPEIAAKAAAQLRSACPACGYAEERPGKGDGYAPAESESLGEGTSVSDAEMRAPNLAPPLAGAPGRKGGSASGPGGPPMFWVTKEATTNPLAKMWSGASQSLGLR